MGKSYLHNSYSGVLTAQSANTTKYYSICNPILSAGTYNDTEAKKTVNASHAGKYSDLRIQIETNTVNETTTVRFRKNAADGNQVIVVPKSTTGFFEDTTNTDTVAVNDNVCISITTGATGTSITTRQLGICFTPEDTRITSRHYINQGHVVAVASTTRYFPLQGLGSVTNTESATAQCKFLKTGTLKRLEIYIEANARTTTTTFKIRKNSVDASQTISVTAGQTGAFINTTNTDAVAVNDVFNYAWTTGTGTEVLTVDTIAVVWESANGDGYCPLFNIGSISTSTIAAGITFYYFLEDTHLTATTSSFVSHPIRVTGIIRDLGLNVTSSSTTASSTLTLGVNNVDTAVTLSVGAAATGFFSDTTNTASITSGDSAYYKLVNGGGGSLLHHQLSSILVDSTPVPPFGKSLFVCGPTTSATTAATTQYSALTSGVPLGSFGTVEADRQIVYRDTGTFSKLLVRLTLNSTNASTTIRTRKNAANGNLTVSPPAGTSGVYEDTANSDAVTAGDKWAYQIVHTGTGTINISLLSVIFSATNTTDTVSRMTVGNTGSITTASATRYMSLSGSLSFSSTEATAQFNIQHACTGKHLAVTISANARTTATTVRTRKNTANGNMSLSIGSGVTGTVEEASPGTNSDTLAVNDLYCYQYVTGTGTANITFVTFSVSLISTTGSAMHALAGIGGIGTVVNATEYIWWSGANPTSATETNFRLKLREAFTFSQLYVKLSANTTGASTTRLRKNGANGNLAASIAASTSGNFSDTTNSDVCVATDEVALQNTWGAGGAVTQIYMSVVSTLPTTVQVTKTRTHKYHVAGPVTGVQTQVIRFQKDSSGTTNATQDIDLLFTPKAIIVSSDCNDFNNIVSGHSSLSYGFSDGTNNTCRCMVSQDNAGTSATGGGINDNAVFVRLDDASQTTILSRATCTFSTNKITFTWAVNDTTATYINVIAYGGPAITNAKVDTINATKTTTGTQDYTGLGFNPSASNSVLFTIGSITRFSFVNTPSGSGLVNIGAATSASNQWAVSTASQPTVSTMNTARVHFTDACLSSLSSSGTLSNSAAFSSWITDGFQLNWTDASTNSDDQFSYLVINGGTWDAGTLQSPTTPTNNVDTTVSVSSNPLRGLFMNGAGATTTGTIEADAINSVGFATMFNQACIGVIDQDNIGTSDTYRVGNNVNILRPLAAAGAAMDTATFDSFPSTSAFRLDWIEADATARYYGWVVVADGGGVAPQNYPVTISESTISISETLVRVQNRIFTINESTISVSQTLVRVQSLVKTISDPSVSVNQTLTRVASYLKPISTETAISVGQTLVATKSFLKAITTEPAVVVSETISRIQNIIKTIAEPAVSTSEILTRVVSYIKAISTEPSVSVGQTLFAVKAFVKSITTEAAVSVSDTLQKLLAATRPITGVTTTTSDSIIKIQSLIKQISESTINVSDSLQGSLLYIISVIESRVKWYYSLLTKKN